MWTDNSLILRGSSETAPATPGYMWHQHIRQLVDAQHGSNCHDDASCDWNLTEVSVGSRPIRRRNYQILQSGGAGGDILRRGWRDEHAHRDRCQSDIGWDVEELLP